MNKIKIYIFYIYSILYTAQHIQKIPHNLHIHFVNKSINIMSNVYNTLPIFFMNYNEPSKMR